jgi:hypothetical protein
MKKLATFLFALLLAGSLSFAQAAGSTDSAAQSGDKKTEGDIGKKGHKSKKHKGKKSKKGSGESATTGTPK